MEATIEEDTHYTLKHRIGAFEEVVGPLQPILAEMPRIFRRVARGELELAEARQLLDEIAQEKPRVAIASLEAYVGEDGAESLCAVSIQILWFLLVVQDVDQTEELLGHQSIGIKAIYFAVDQRQVPGMTPLPCTLTLEVTQ